MSEQPQEDEKNPITGSATPKAGRGLHPHQFRALPASWQRGIQRAVGSIDIPARTQRKATGLYEQSVNAEERGNATASTTYLNQARRLTRALGSGIPARASMNRSVTNRVTNIEQGATTYRKLGESLPGGSWYHKAARDLFTGIPEEHTDAVNVGSAILSGGTDPEDEHAIARELHHGIHGGGTVHLHPKIADLVGAPAELHGQTVPIRNLPGHVVSNLVTNREKTQQYTMGMNLDTVARGSKVEALSEAHDVIRGASPAVIDPLTSPKYYAYAAGKRMAIDEIRSGSHAEEDLEAKAHDLGVKIRQSQMSDEELAVTGEVRLHPAQMPLLHDPDYTGGTHSPTAVTAEDTWQRASSIGHPDPTVFKAMGDITLSTGKAMHGDQRIAPIGASGFAQYAAENEATIRAGEELTKKHLTGHVLHSADSVAAYPVPAILAQSANWTAIRRRSRKSPRNLNQRQGPSQDPEWTEEESTSRRAGLQERRAAGDPSARGFIVPEDPHGVEYMKMVRRQRKAEARRTARRNLSNQFEEPEQGTLF